ncbi:hypothetical protein MKW92_016505 [Papaver armeniacum]|nr:hypothetical protein MKW92_016505 [Papaver armeniacum]
MENQLIFTLTSTSTVGRSSFISRVSKSVFLKKGKKKLRNINSINYLHSSVDPGLFIPSTTTLKPISREYEFGMQREEV